MLRIPDFSDKAIVSDIIDLNLPHTVYILREMWGDLEFTKNQLIVTAVLMDKYGIKDIMSEAIFHNCLSADLYGKVESEKATQMVALNQMKPAEYIAVTVPETFSILAGDNNDLYQKQNAALKASMELANSMSNIIEELNQALLPLLLANTCDSVKSFIIEQVDSNFLHLDIGRIFEDMVSYCSVNSLDLPIELEHLKSVMKTEKNEQQNREQAIAHISELLKKIEAVLENDDPDEDIVENILTLGLLQVLKNDNSKFLAEDFLRSSDESVYTFFLKSKAFLKTRMTEAKEQLKTNPLNGIKTLVDLGQSLNVDASIPFIKNYVKNITIVKQLKENYVEQLDLIQQFQKQLVVNSLNDPLKIKIFHFLLDLKTIKLLIKNQLSAIEQKKSQKLLSYSSHIVLDFLYQFDVDNVLVQNFERKSELWDMAMERTKRFYHFSKRREDVMIDMVKENIANNNYPAQNILFCMGGFHSDYVQRELSRQKIANSLCITPQKSASKHSKVEEAYHSLFK